MTFRQEDHHHYAGGLPIMPSCGLLPLSLTLILGFFFSLYHHHHRRCCRWCTAAGEIRQGPGLQRSGAGGDPTSANKLLLLSPGTTEEILAANLNSSPIFCSNQNRCRLGTVSGCVHQVRAGRNCFKQGKPD